MDNWNIRIKVEEVGRVGQSEYERAKIIGLSRRSMKHHVGEAPIYMKAS